MAWLSLFSLQVNIIVSHIGITIDHADSEKVGDDNADLNVHVWKGLSCKRVYCEPSWQCIYLFYVHCVGWSVCDVALDVITDVVTEGFTVNESSSTGQTSSFDYSTTSRTL